MYISITIIAITAMAAIAIYFFRSKNQLERQHRHVVSEFQKQLDMHKKQLVYREQGLNTYHFLIYNLDEALRVQKEITV